MILLVHILDTPRQTYIQIKHKRALVAVVAAVAAVVLAATTAATATTTAASANATTTATTACLCLRLRLWIFWVSYNLFQLIVALREFVSAYFFPRKV